MSDSKVSSTEFQQNVGLYQDAAQRSPVYITKNGRDHTVLLSADFYASLIKGRIARRVEDLDDATVKAISEAEVPTEYDYLDNKIKN